MKRYKVFFYSRGGHAAGRTELSNEPGEWYEVSADRLRELVGDEWPEETLRSPFE